MSRANSAACLKDELGLPLARRGSHAPSIKAGSTREREKAAEVYHSLVSLRYSSTKSVGSTQSPNSPATL